MKIKNQKIISAWWKKEGNLTLEEYIEKGGFSFLKEALSGKISKEDILEELEKSGLKGRGGSGFLLGKKWRMALENAEKAKDPTLPAKSPTYFICNADESEPGTYKDRMILEKNPFSVLEAIILGSWIIGAKESYIYLNGTYRDTALHLKREIQVLKRNNWLGKNIQKSDFSLRIKVFEGAGSYVCGEETALINSLEGKRGEPRMRPPYPVEKGLFGRPTLVNNVETLANVIFILKEGASKFKKSETKLFLLNGRVKNSGLHEAVLGITLNELIDSYGGGLEKGVKIRFIQLGGSGGKIYLPEEFDKPLDFSGKGKLNIGSGAILLVEEGFEVKKLIKAWSSFFRRESCGKCVPCREGTYQLSLMANKLQQKKLKPADRDKIEDIIFTMQKASFCPLGIFAVNGWKGILEKFPEDIIE